MINDYKTSLLKDPKEGGIANLAYSIAFNNLYHVFTVHFSMNTP